MTPRAQITVEQLAALLNSRQPPQLIDCRTHREWQFCRIEGARHIPMNMLQLGVQELDRSAPIVVYCHHGIRSQAAVEFLAQAGCQDVRNLAGGIDAWSQSVDPDVPRY